MKSTACAIPAFDTQERIQSIIINMTAFAALEGYFTTVTTHSMSIRNLACATRTIQDRPIGVSPHAVISFVKVFELHKRDLG